MIAIAKAIYKSKEFIEGYTFESNKRTVVVKEQYKLKIDEIDSNGAINQQTIVAYADNEALMHKLENLIAYQQVNFVVDISYYRGTLSKIIVLDVIDSKVEQEEVANIFSRYGY